MQIVTAGQTWWQDAVRGARWVSFIPLGFIGGELVATAVGYLASLSTLIYFNPTDSANFTVLVSGVLGFSAVQIGAVVAPTESDVPGIVMGAIVVTVYSTFAALHIYFGDAAWAISAIVVAIAAGIATYQHLPPRLRRL